MKFTDHNARLFGMGFLALILGGLSPIAGMPPVIEKRSTLTTISNQQIEVIIYLDNHGKLDHERILFPPLPEEAVTLSQDFIVLAKDHRPILFRAIWKRDLPRKLDNVIVRPLKPRKTPVNDEDFQETYFLTTNEGAELKLICTWHGTDLTEISLLEGNATPP